MEYGLYLSFSSEGTPWTDVSDTLEVVMDFLLPPEAVVFDSWLWVGEDTVRADIMDRWTASLIYESIVNRRRDPSILTKQSSTHYELRVFPMAGNETRKIKIAFLMPTSWNKQFVSSDLPMGFFREINVPPPFFKIMARVDETWIQPRILQDTTLEFELPDDPNPGGFLQLAIPSRQFENELDIGYTTPVVDGRYFSTYKIGNEGIYQLALFPSDLIDTLAGSKIAILVDYDGSNTAITVPRLLDMIKDEMLANLNPRDSFNLIFSNLSIHRYGEDWVAATPGNIEEAFSSLVDPLSNYSNLASLLGNGIGFINDQGGEGQVVLITDADQYNKFSVANTLINDLLALMHKPIPIHIADYQSTDWIQYYFDNQVYKGNGYLNTNLSKMTGGSCQRVLDGHGPAEVIGLSFRYSGGSIRSFDMHTSMEGGFCHSRYFINGSGNRAYIHDAIMQVGKFRGSFPFSLELSGEFNEQVFNENIQIEAQQAVSADSVSEEIWIGQYIRQLESVQQSNDVINEIIFYSLTERVLSRYTSFLCLEPGFDPGEIEEGGDDEWIAIQVEPHSESDSLRVYPNPFKDLLTIELGGDPANEIIELSIYNMTGSMIHRFDPGDFAAGGSGRITWNGTSGDGSPVQAGMYLLVYRTSRISKTIKLVKQ